MDVCQHRCTGLRVKVYYEDNANQLTLEVPTKNVDGTPGDSMEITLYGLPLSVTMKLVAALADDETRFAKHPEWMEGSVNLDINLGDE